MRKIPMADNNDPNYVSITAGELILKLKKLDRNTVILSWDGEVIKSLQQDKENKRIVYLSPKD